ncbi:MAG: HVO_A0114 family putative DNA-binding protein [Burkholderiales bacterium]
MSHTILNVCVGCPPEKSLERAAETMRAIERGETPVPYFGVGFEDVGRMLSIFTPKRLDLIRALRETGPITIAELARRLARNYKNVHNDCERLIEWLALEKDEEGRVLVPYSEILIDLRFPEKEKEAA